MWMGDEVELTGGNERGYYHGGQTPEFLARVNVEGACSSVPKGHNASAKSYTLNHREGCPKPNLKLIVKSLQEFGDTVSLECEFCGEERVVGLLEKDRFTCL